MNDNMIKYYQDRANEYEKIYAKPERQQDLQSATSLIQQTVAGRSVLEIACGTGYWTQKIAATASSVLATDINSAVVTIAEQKHYHRDNVKFEIADIYQIKNAGRYQTLFGGFIWSHIPLQHLGNFLDTVHALLAPGDTVMFIDNVYVAGSSQPITGQDEHGNTYQTRTLEDDSVHKVLKNFPTEEFLRQQLYNKAANISIQRLTYFWILSYTIL